MESVINAMDGVGYLPVNPIRIPFTPASAGAFLLYRNRFLSFNIL